MAMQPTGNQRESEASTEQLKNDLRQLSQTVEELVKATSDDSRGHISEARERAQQRLNETRAKLEARSEKVYESAREQMDCCDRYVRENPWTSIGIGAGVGVVIGLLIGRR
ncbi:DUF883 family protein [Chromohalobacter nigrandesensis]|uniref:DUF883 family protein n=1 Tax=Chromohalobacter nigrandesensis TaxID=119863 RepID=UPI001FF5D240|nr:YqjD family protein [Chromohalobacter nigrandesensis]MCK0743925.1 YqjD family protein [Chromohalobacter nigrandesensis]